MRALRRIGAWLAVGAMIVASETSARAASLEAGLEAGVLLRQEAYGGRTPLFTFGPHAELRFTRYLGIGLSYHFSFVNEGSLLTGLMQYHRVLLRPQLSLPLGPASPYLALGPQLTFIHSRYFDQGISIAAETHARVGFSGELGVAFTIGSVIVRAWFDLAWPVPRFDLAAGLGAAYRWGTP
jgi:hypothetical protein